MGELRGIDGECDEDGVESVEDGDGTEPAGVEAAFATGELCGD